MMRGSKGMATAVRTPDGNMDVKFEEHVPYAKRNKLLGLPVIRGFVGLVESLVIGINTLNYSAALIEEDEDDDSKLGKWIDDKLGDKKDEAIMAFTLIVSLIVSFGLFFVLPTAAANSFKRVGVGNGFFLNIIEGIIRVSILLLYICFIGRMEDIKRVFQYHGAEHKTIFCYENEDELTPQNAKKYPRLHPRCGTNFIFLVMIVSIMVFSMLKWNTLWERVLWRLLLLPLVSGMSYELIKWMGRSDNWLSRVLAYPGLMLQKITTCEPDESQLEVAIKALKRAEGIDVENDEEVGECNEES